MTIGLFVAAVLVLLAVPAQAGESRFDDVRLIVGRGWKGSFDDEKGALISDSQTKRLRFDVGGRTLVDVRFEQLTAARYEQAQYPKRWFGRSWHYLTLHYIRDTGEPAFDVLLLPAASADHLLSALERDTDIRIERGPAATSFLGLPVHVAIGNRVEVTRESGARVRGTVSQLSASFVDLGPSGRFDAASIREIRVRDGVWEGVAIGTAASMIPALFVTLSECLNDPCSGLGMLSFRGWSVVAAGAIIGAAVDGGSTRHAYRRTDRRSAFGVQWSPVIGNNQAGMLVSLQF
jgi:hypothetical protein